MRGVARPMLGAAVLAAAVAAPAASQAPRRGPVSADSLQRIVERRVQAGTPGLIVGVIEPGGARTVAAAGFARPNVPVTAQTLFEIGSISKVFTGILLAEMAARGEVRLDQPVSELLPAGTVVPSRNGIAVTLGQLSSQISGLPRMPANITPANPSNPYADYSVAQMYEFLAGHTLRRDPGVQYEYSNLGVGLLGHALALRAGKTYEALLRERVLAPLGMTSTVVTLTPALLPRMSYGHSADGDTVSLWDIPTLAGAGALRSSMTDMLAFLAANLRPPANALGRAIDSSHAARFRVNAALSLGLNWHISHFNGDTLLWHNGGTGGFRTMLAFHPRSGRGAVLLGNASADNEDIVRHVLLGLPMAPVAIRSEVTLPVATLDEYVGRYEFAPTFALAVMREGERLWVRATNQPRFRIYAEAKDRFFLKVVPARLEFERDSTGVVTAVILEQNGRQRGRRTGH